MLLNNHDASLRALRGANPRAQAGFDSLVADSAALREATVATGSASVYGVVARPAAARPRGARPTRRLVGLSAGAAFAVVAAVVAAVLLLGGGNPGWTPTPALAAEAAKKAAVDTTAAARSGVIETFLLIDGDAQVQNRLAWNGDDLSFMVEDDEQRQIRYVDGRYYETYGYSVAVALGDTTHVGEWIHVTSYDEGATRPTGVWANEEATPAQWLTAARGDLAGEGLVELVSGAEGYTRTTGDDGSVSYSGTTTVAALQAQDWSLSGLPMASQPSFKVKDPNTPVAVTLTVGADGLIRQLRLDWVLDIPGEAKDWSYTSAYSDLGSAPVIVTPDPDRTITTDTRFPASEAGPM